LSAELIAILVTSLIEVTFLGSILYRMYTKMNADDARSISKVEGSKRYSRR
jgi:hypothetical protein